MGTVTKHGREFQFDDETPADVQEKRILNWMKQNAASELEPEKTEQPEGKKKFNSKLAMAAQMALSGMPGANLMSHLPGVKDRLGDVNLYRTLAQGALPVADEATAGVRSLLPESWGGADYTTALGEERQGVKDYANEHGPGEAMGIEALGAIGTLPIGGALMQGAKALPVAGRGIAAATRMAAANPWKAAPLIGGLTGAATGFASGEDGFEDRAKNAVGTGLLGAGLGTLAHAGVQGVKTLGNLGANNAVANYLRKRIAGEKNININDPNFTDTARQTLRGEMRDQQSAWTDPMLADLLPRTSEAVLQKPGAETNNLANNILNRQYNKGVDDVTARAKSQFGRVEDAMDGIWNKDTFKATDEALLAARKQNANALFEPAYQMNIRTPEIDDALDRIKTLNPNIWQTAKKWADSERRAVGPIDATGSLRSYNTQFLHDIKRSMDEALGAEGRANPRFNDMPYVNAKKALNDAMKDANEPYKRAMQQYGDDSDRLAALAKGRDEVFVPGSVDNVKAMDANAIKAYLNDPNIPQDAKDLFQTGAARALRQNVLASQSKKFSHNWADFINNPEIQDRVKALLDNKSIGAWDMFHNKLTKESQNYKNLVTGALGNSKTAARQELMKELEGPNLGAVASAAVNPTAPSTLRNIGQFALDKLNRADMVSNKVAELLGRKGASGNRSSLRDLEALMRQFDRREGTFDRVSRAAPAAAAYVYPGREQ